MADEIKKKTASFDVTYFVTIGIKRTVTAANFDEAEKIILAGSNPGLRCDTPRSYVGGCGIAEGISIVRTSDYS